MYSMLRENRSSTQDGSFGFRYRRRFIANRRSSSSSSKRSTQIFNSALHSVAGACLSMSRCKLSSAFVSEDETSRSAHEKLQEENSWWMSHLQATHCTVLLSCQALSRSKMFGAVLSEYKTETQETTAATEVSLFLLLSIEIPPTKFLLSSKLDCNKNK